MIKYNHYLLETELKRNIFQQIRVVSIYKLLSSVKRMCNQPLCIHLFLSGVTMKLSQSH